MKSDRITILTKEKGRPLGNLFGIFFEDINHSADGGLYAEMVQNRSFEFQEIDHPTYHALTAWERVGGEEEISLSIKEGDAVSAKNPHYLQMVPAEGARNVGVKNRGFGGGMCFRRRREYFFSCYARCLGDGESRLRVELQKEGELAVAQEELTVGKQWKKYELVLEADENVRSGSLALIIADGGGVDVDFVSLFPAETFRGRRNGLRADLAEALEELKPKFVRFPGGCLVHDGSLDADARDSLYRWKNTIGPLEDRPARRNNWRYNQTLGLGYYEYFLFCEDIGAKPVPILPAAYDPHHKRAVPVEELQPWIQETLDLIEFANGDEKTHWGSVRTKLGHREPFGLEYLGIGNEEVGEGFRERFPYFVKAVREKYPEIKIIGSSGPFCGGREYEKGWKCAMQNGADLVDEHYYMSPEWFIANVHRYENFKEHGPGVFLGEYAACSNTGKSALAEAAYMTQLQNAAHAVKMACYAPLLCHREYVNWKPDLIWFDNKNLCKTVNYEVQKLFMNHQGDELLPCKLETETVREPLIAQDVRKQGTVYFWGNEARVGFSDIKLCNTDTGEEVFFSDKEVLADKLPVLLTEDAPINFTLKFRAKELEGWKGFRVYFAWKDEKNRMCWELGGWQNQDGAIVEEIEGKGSFLTQNQFEVVQGQEYQLELRVSGDRVEGWIDGELFQSAILTPILLEPLYLTASRDSATSDIILKAVNLRKESMEADILLPDLDGETYLCESYVLLEKDCTKCEDFPEVETADVIRKTVMLGLHWKEKRFRREFPGRSVTVLRIKRSLIEKLKQDPEKFRKEGGEYQLLEEYFHGLPTETLHDLLCYEDQYIKELTLWIISELGSVAAKEFLEEAASQMNDEDPVIYCWSSEIVAYSATGKYMDDFMRIFAFFEHSNDKIRAISMNRILLLSESRIKKAYAYSVNNKILSDSHEKGLLSLIHINTLTASDITEMLESDDSIIRKYGVIAASKVYEKYPEIIKEAVNSEDLDVQDFAKKTVKVKAEMAQLHDRWHNRKRNH